MTTRDPDHLLRATLAAAPTLQHRGRIVDAVGFTIRATGLRAHIGQSCEIRDRSTGLVIPAEVIGLRGETTLLMPLKPLNGLSADCEIVPGPREAEVLAGSGLLGRVIDVHGKPLDDLGPLTGELHRQPLYADAPGPLQRTPINRIFPTGVRAIDGLLSIGVGQRVGIFSMAGVGKSTILGMLGRNCGADMNVIALVGERGREVREFLEQALGPEGLARSVVIVATSDRPAMERVRAANMATAVAEHFRAQGRQVLFLMDSVTRFARALREVGLAAGEPAVRRGFPSSVFAELPRLFERVGAVGDGSITAFYSVLMEDEEGDPIAEEVRSILDGHLVLSRRLAEKGRFPAIDVASSVSRLFARIASAEQVAATTRIRAMMAKYAEVEFLLQVGEYKAGNDPMADEAIERMPAIEGFLRQTPEYRCASDAALQALLELAA